MTLSLGIDPVTSCLRGEALSIAPILLSILEDFPVPCVCEPQK